METTRMDLLVTLDEHYLPQLRVMLTSLRLSHPGVQCRVLPDGATSWCLSE